MNCSLGACKRVQKRTCGGLAYEVLEENVCFLNRRIKISPYSFLEIFNVLFVFYTSNMFYPHRPFLIAGYPLLTGSHHIECLEMRCINIIDLFKSRSTTLIFLCDCPVQLCDSCFFVCLFVYLFLLLWKQWLVLCGVFFIQKLRLQIRCFSFLYLAHTFLNISLSQLYILRCILIFFLIPSFTFVSFRLNFVIFAFRYLGFFQIDFFLINVHFLFCYSRGTHGFNFKCI